MQLKLIEVFIPSLYQKRMKKNGFVLFPYIDPKIKHRLRSWMHDQINSYIWLNIRTPIGGTRTLQLDLGSYRWLYLGSWEEGELDWLESLLAKLHIYPQW